MYIIQYLLPDARKDDCFFFGCGIKYKANWGGSFMKIGFDNEKYFTLQTQRIRERVDSFGGKLYLEFGGKLFADASEDEG